MKTHLDDLDMLDMIDGTDNPSDPDWQLKNKKVKKEIIKHVAPCQIEYVCEKDTAKEMWDTLHNTHQRQSRTRRIYIKKRLNLMVCEPSESLEKYFMRYETTIREYKNAGGTVQEDEMIVQLLSSLPDSFNSITAALETKDEKELTFDKVKILLLKHEEKIKGKANDIVAPSSAPSSVAFGARRQDVPQCYNCNQLGHKSPQCPKNKRRNEARNGRVAFIADSTDVDDFQFIIDSGASDHLVKHVSMLTQVTALTPPIAIKVAKEGDSISCEQKGNLNLISRIGRREVEVTLTAESIIGSENNRPWR